MAIIAVATPLYMCPWLSGSAKSEDWPGSAGSSPAIDEDMTSDVKDDRFAVIRSVQCMNTAEVSYELQRLEII